MNAQQVAPASGYAQSFGTKQAAVFELAGPSSYPTGGQTVDAATLGWGGFDYVSPGEGLSYSGTYSCKVQYLPVDAAPSAQKGAVGSVKVQWFVVSTGVEAANATDLDGEIVRLFALGV